MTVVEYGDDEVEMRGLISSLRVTVVLELKLASTVAVKVVTFSCRMILEDIWIHILVSKASRPLKAVVL